MILSDFFAKLEADKYITTMFGKDIKKARLDLEKITGPSIDVEGTKALIANAQRNLDQAGADLAYALKELKGGAGKPGTPKRTPPAKPPGAPQG
jgi:outer membrane protein TolC